MNRKRILLNLKQQKNNNMTHFFLVGENEMTLINNGTKAFDILKFNRSVSIGDTILYQLDKQEPEDGEGERSSGVLPEEISRKVDYLFEDSEGALKKGYVGVGFVTKKSNED